MKLIIETKTIKLEYEDGYSMLEDSVKERLREIIKTLYSFEPIQEIPIGSAEGVSMSAKNKTNNYGTKTL